MNRKPLLMAWLSLVMMAGAIIAPASQVKVMTCNIERCITQTSYSSANAQKIARIVNYYNPDVLAINELSCASGDTARTQAAAQLLNWANAYLTNWPEKYVYVSLLGDGYIRNAILSKYPFDPNGYSNDSLNPRGLLGAVIDLPGEADIKIFDAHLKAYSDSSSASTRQSGANTIKSRVTMWVSTSTNITTPYIICGDMNEDESNPQYVTTDTNYHPITTILQSGVSDFMPDNLYGNTKTISSSSPTRRFDYVLPSAHLNSTGGQVVNTNILYNNGALPSALQRLDSYGSDHLAVFGVFEINDFSLGDIRSLASGSPVYTYSRTTTASYSDHFYIQDPNKPIAMRVNSTANPGAGKLVDIVGTMSVSPTAEDAVIATAVKNKGSATTAIRPYAMTNRDVNGEPYNSTTVDNYHGPSNAALLVSVWGRVEEPSAGMFYINDGSGCRVRVSSAKSVESDDFVSVVGVVGFSTVNGRPERFIEARSNSDVQIYSSNI